MPKPHIQVILSDANVPRSLQLALQRTHATASFWPLSESLGCGTVPTGDAVVVVLPEDAQSVVDGLRVLLHRLADRPRATLVLKSTRSPPPRLHHPPVVPVTFAGGLGEDELAARLATMLDMRHSLDSLHRQMLANRRSEQTAARRYQNQLRLAGQVQREFLPDTPLPRLQGISFEVLYRPVDFVSGDLYDIRRLDEDHVGIAVADATGHGIPAALLTVFVKRALRGKETHNGSYRILPPDEVLSRLNTEILDADLSECRFVAAAYAVVNLRTLEGTLARGGAPYPVLRRSDGTLEILRPDGGVVGVLPEARFEVENFQLERGDALLLSTDGLERLVSKPAARSRGSKRRCACHASGVNGRREADPKAERAAGSGDRFDRPVEVETDFPPAVTDDGQPRDGWLDALRVDTPDAVLQQLGLRFETLRRVGCALDDLTVLCLHAECAPSEGVCAARLTTRTRSEPRSQVSVPV